MILIAVASFRPDIALTWLLRYRYGRPWYGRLATAASRSLANTSETSNDHGQVAQIVKQVLRGSG
jgi:hypothetical protein